MKDLLPWAITVGAMGVLVYVLGKPPNPNPEPNPTGDCRPKATTCMDGTTAAAPCYCDTRGGVAPAACQKIQDPAAFYRCLERNV